jgi:hypothetical protein
MSTLLRRSIATRLKSLGSFIAAGIWWFLEWITDKAFGDAAFGWIKTMVGPAVDLDWLRFGWTYGIPLGLVSLGLYFFWRAGRASASTPPPAFDRQSTLERALVENPECVKGSLPYLKFQSWFDPQSGSLSPADKVSRGREEFQKICEAALKGDYEAYLLAGHLGSWLRANARFYWASSEPYHEMARFIDNQLDQLHNHSKGTQSPELTPVKKESRSEWAKRRTRFQIWEAACYIHDLGLSDYISNDCARSTANEIVYYTGRGLIRLAGEDELGSAKRTLRDAGKSKVTESTYLDASTVEEIKKSGLGSWISAIDNANRKHGF